MVYVHHVTTCEATMYVLHVKEKSLTYGSRGTYMKPWHTLVVSVILGERGGCEGVSSEAGMRTMSILKW